MTRSRSRLSGEVWRVEALDNPLFSQSVVRALSILESFSVEHPVLGVKDIADLLGMSRSTVHRYMSTFVGIGYLEQLPDRRYRLGLAVTDLGMSVLSSSELRVEASPYLRELQRSSGYTVSLAVLDGIEVLCVDRVRGLRYGWHEVGHHVDVGSRLPAYCTATGKVLLAHLGDAERAELVSGLVLRRQGPNTITSKKALRAELKRVREEGVAVENEELREGLVSIAVSVRGASRDVVGSVGLEANASRISSDGLRDGLAPHLVSCADQISARLGYRREEQAR